MLGVLLLMVILAFALVFLFYIKPLLDPFNRGVKYLEEGKKDEALLEFVRAIEKDPENYEAHYRLARLYLEKGILSKAEEHFKRVLEIGKFTEEIQRLDILEEMGKIQFKLKKLEDAFFTFKEILSIFPHNYTANYYMGLIFAGQLAYEEAYEYFVNAFKSRPNDINSYINAALCLFQMGEYDEAISTFEKAVKIAPDNDKARLFLGIACFKNKLYKKAVENLIPVIRLSTEKKYKFIAYRLTAISFFYQGKKEAIDEFMTGGIEYTKTNSMIEEYKTLLYDYGMINILLKKWEDAYQKLKTLQVIEPYHPTLEELIAYVEWHLKITGEETKEETKEETSEKKIPPVIESYFHSIEHQYEIKEEEKEELSPEDKMELVFEDIKLSWLDSILPDSLLWNLGKLTSSIKLNLEMLQNQEKNNLKEEIKKAADGPSLIKALMKMDRKNFEMLGRKIVNKLGYIVVRENFRPSLADFVEGDGIDFICKDVTKNEMCLIQVRRWDQGKVGEIPFHSLLSEMVKHKIRKGIFIIPADLTDGAKKFIEEHPNITVITYNELIKILRDII